MTFSPWIAVALAVPVLLLGEWLVRHLAVLRRFNIPAPVVGGLLLSLLVLGANVSGLLAARFETGIAAQWWTWLVTTEPEWVKAPTKSANLPFLVAFFTCIGLNASWTLVKRGSLQVLLFLGLAAVLAVIQNCVGVGLAKLMGVQPLLGLVCGSVSMTGGHGNVLGFAADFEAAGLKGAAVVGVAAATFGLVAGGLLGGPIGGGIIRKRDLKSAAPASTHLELGQSGESGILQDLRALTRFGRPVLLHVLLLLGCVKVGAWVSFGIQQAGITFPVYMGAMILGLAVRNILDLSGARWVRTEIMDTLGSVTLGIFLVIAMMSLNLIELANAALPMLVILAFQVAIMAAYARWVTYPAMGRDFDAAVMAGGHCGFGLGATPNAVANMKVLVERFGPAPRAFLVVPIVGAFLIDILNAVNITAFLNFLK